MCGIAGIVNLECPTAIEENLLRKMAARLRHRGPDEAGIYLDPQVGLVHTRLSIIGLDGGTQPLANEDETLWIVYNGEAFNYPELREELQRQGHRFATATDTEVILHLYEQYGAACLERINGQFALAIWDARRQELFLARDRMGIRPLYYTRAGGQLVFASEIKALLLHPEVSRELDLQALSQVFTFWTRLSPRTLFRQIRELPPGHFLTLGGGRLVEQRWWNLPWHPPAGEWPGSQAEAREELAALLADAVRLRLRADVPVGSYLSGGFDSSLLSSLAADQVEGLRTFSLGFAEAAFDESSYQQEMVRHLGTWHHHLTVQSDEIRRRLPEVIWHCETPLLRTAPVPLFLLSQRVQESGLKVVLTGEGADEVFAGYNIFKEAKVRRYCSGQPASRRRPRLLERLYPYVFADPGRQRYFLQKYFALTPDQAADPCFSHRLRWENGLRHHQFFSREVTAALAGCDPLAEMSGRLPANFPDRDDLARAQWLEMSIFLADYLLSSQGDRVAMAHSLELRHPFLDFRVIDFAARLPPRWKMPGLKEKFFLKKSFDHRLPPRICRRPKQPYRAPIQEIFAASGEKNLVDYLLSEEQLRHAGLFDPQRVSALLTRLRHSRPEQASEGQNMAITGIATAQLLHHQFVAGAWLEDLPPARVDRLIRRPQRWHGREPGDFRFAR
ncbi:MAG: asparagine synthase (glutamine-hydrolyzing) [Desulfuromonadales bacterium]|nr:asparagine synthase (glutamine-hydrolyzing) [Desulfuromonadales bacterium]